MMNNIKLLTRNRITSKFIHNYEKNKCNDVVLLKKINYNKKMIKRNNDFMKDKLDNILSPHAKEYLKLEQEMKHEMKNDFHLQRKLGHHRGVVKRTQNKTGFFWGLYTGFLFSGLAGGCYVFDK